MSYVERDFDCEELHPIDIVETLAEERDWDFDRIGDDQIAMAIEGTWSTYSVTLALSHQDQSLRLICAFPMDPPEERLRELYTVMGMANDKCWSGAFTMWSEQSLMAYRYSLNLAGGAQASSAQINDMVRCAIAVCERFYPAFQLVAAGEDSAENSLGMAMAEAYGRA
ncbi:YbjN domain-containing protein [Amaricoccus macauensis]|uniref:YbjN domain-containing protein n=1 Tax=Amaricoccus macauensis TaxID=57001 RepID=UPI003C798F3D